MTTVNEFAARLNRAGRNIDRIAEPILERFADIVADRINEGLDVPRRTSESRSGNMTQTRPGVIELQGGHLVGQLRGTSQSSPKSRTFLTDAFESESGRFGAAVAETALRAIADDVAVRGR